MPLPVWARQVARNINVNSPTIMSGFAVAGVISTAVLAARASVKAKASVKKNHDENWPLADDGEFFFDKKEIFELSWRFYIPAAVSGAATIALIIGSNRVGVRRQIAMAGAYTLLDGAFSKYKDEVLEQIGEKKEQAVRDAVAVREMEKNPVQNAQVILVGGGDQLCYESLSGRYFRSNAEAIRRAQNEFNRELLGNSMYSDLNEWFELLGLEHTDLGGVLGWSVERTLDTFFTSHLTGNGEPCLAIGYKHHPFEDFGKL